jgi:transcriptional regulator with XRE-family HTH domain
MNPQERFAVNLRKARTEAKVSQEELGYMCDLHRTEVSLLERAGREPRMATIVKLAGALGTSPAKLCEGISWLPKARRFDVKRPPRA